MTIATIGKHGAATLDRALGLLMELAGPGVPQDLGVVAAALGLPPSTARRLAATLLRHGLVDRVAPGRFVAGSRMAALVQARRPHAVLVEAARPIAQRLADRLGAHVHVGVFEHDMVTYLVCARGAAGGDLFTREGMQLEAYCTAIGKMVLAWLPAPLLERYLAAGPFVALTEATITDPHVLHRQLADVGRSGVAVEIGEIASDLACTAVRLRGADGAAHAAISVAWRPSAGAPRDMLRQLRRAARRIETKTRRARDGDG